VHRGAAPDLLADQERLRRLLGVARGEEASARSRGVAGGAGPEGTV
jgi:hypothetical protein